MGVEGHNFGCDPGGVEAIADQIGAGRGNDKPHGINWFAAIEGNSGEAKGSCDGDGGPEKATGNFMHEYCILADIASIM